MKTKGLAQLLVLDESRDGRIDAAIGSQAHQIRCAANHVAKVQKGSGTEL